MTEANRPDPATDVRESKRLDVFSVALIFATLVALLAFGWLLSRIDPSRAPEVGEGAIVLPEPIPLPDFSLVDHDGRPFERGDLEGQWSLLFFGYSSCPDVCPFVLSELVRVKNAWEERSAEGELPQIIFVSVDPKRDTPERLREYVPFFDTTFRGVSGPKDELAELTRKLGVYYDIRSEDGGEDAGKDYLVDHSAKLWLIDPQARYFALLDDPHEPGPFVELIERIHALGDVP